MIVNFFEIKIMKINHGKDIKAIFKNCRVIFAYSTKKNLTLIGRQNWGH